MDIPYSWYYSSLVVSVFFYIRRQKGICTIDEAKKRRTEIINILAITITAGVVGYIIFLYVILEYIGKWQGIWS